VFGHPAARLVVTAINRESDPVLLIATTSNPIYYRIQLPVSWSNVLQYLRFGVNGQLAVTDAVMVLKQEHDLVLLIAKISTRLIYPKVDRVMNPFVYRNAILNNLPNQKMLLIGYVTNQSKMKQFRNCQNAELCV